MTVWVRAALINVLISGIEKGPLESNSLQTRCQCWATGIVNLGLRKSLVRRKYLSPHWVRFFAGENGNSWFKIVEMFFLRKEEEMISMRNKKRNK